MKEKPKKGSLKLCVFISFYKEKKRFVLDESCCSTQGTLSDRAASLSRIICYCQCCFDYLFDKAFFPCPGMHFPMIHSVSVLWSPAGMDVFVLVIVIVLVIIFPTLVTALLCQPGLVADIHLFCGTKRDCGKPRMFLLRAGTFWPLLLPAVNSTRGTFVRVFPCMHGKMRCVMLRSLCAICDETNSSRRKLLESNQKQNYIGSSSCGVN